MDKLKDKKTCKNCGKCKSLNLFQKSGIRKDGTQRFRAQCKSCYNSNWKYNLMRNINTRSKERSRFDGAKRIRYSKSPLVNGAFLEELMERQSGNCYWLGIPIDFTMEDTLRKASIDRLDNSKGYELDNIVLTTVFANTARRDASTEEMTFFVEKYLKKTT